MPTITNRISLQISEADVTEILAAVKVLQDKLVPHLIDLGPEDRRGLPKMGSKTVSFVGKALDYARDHKEFCPPFVELEEFQRDLDAVELLFKLQRPLAQVADMVEDSLMLAGSEAYGAALACYQTIKGAARLNVPGAGTIAEELSQRFLMRSSRAQAPTNGVSRAEDVA